MAYILIISSYIFTFIVGLFFNKFLPTYFNKKGENQAIKEDIGKITKEIEEIKNIYKNQNALSKVEREFYNEMIEVIYKFLSQIKKHEYESGEKLTKELIASNDNYTVEFHEFIDVANKILGKAFVFLNEGNYVLLRDAIRPEDSVCGLVNNLLKAMRKSIHKDTNLTYSDLKEIQY